MQNKTNREQIDPVLLKLFVGGAIRTMPKCGDQQFTQLNNKASNGLTDNVSRNTNNPHSTNWKTQRKF
jgi:hypothetical protein